MKKCSVGSVSLPDIPKVHRSVRIDVLTRNLSLSWKKGAKPSGVLEREFIYKIQKKAVELVAPKNIPLKNFRTH